MGDDGGGTCNNGISMSTNSMASGNMVMGVSLISGGGGSSNVTGGMVMPINSITSGNAVFNGGGTCNDDSSIP